MLIHGECLDEMKKMEENSIDFIVTDPPYGLHFMGKDWDKFKQNRQFQNALTEVYSLDGYKRIAKPITCSNHDAGTYDDNRNDEFQEFMNQFGILALKVLKHGGMLAMFGAPRRHHRQMSGLEDSGFEIRDVIMWLFGQGFPKSHNFGRELGQEWNGYGTGLKPAYEPIILAMKPLDGTFKQNAEKWGVSGINIDDSRISVSSEDAKSMERVNTAGSGRFKSGKFGSCGIDGFGDKSLPYDTNKGRWPANIILDEDAAEQLDEMTGILNSGSPGIRRKNHNSVAMGYLNKTGNIENGFGDSGGASRFFYCAKASSAERNKGMNSPEFPDRSNNHPTVKPISLMKYIIKLLAPPGDPILLDPFAGSGSTLIAAKELGIRSIGIEKELEYFEIAKQRLEHYMNKPRQLQMAIG